MHVFDLCDRIREKPSIFLDGDKSLRRLRSFLTGYEAGSNGVGLAGAEDLRMFNLWVAEQLGFSESTSGWCNMVGLKAGSDEKAFDLFFELLDKYRSQEPSHNSKG
jgi:hypothetical protein